MEGPKIKIQGIKLNKVYRVFTITWQHYGWLFEDAISQWYESDRVYDVVTAHSPDADLVIPPRFNAVENDKVAPPRNCNIIEIETMGRMQWQKTRQYGRKNYSEPGVQRYQQIFCRYDAHT